MDAEKENPEIFVSEIKQKQELMAFDPLIFATAGLQPPGGRTVVQEPEYTQHTFRRIFE